ncbi:uncharacterized protein [Medicago truncatula]|uniref:uncharacterized protein isoform X3 n=1 Tax=Medicago truncatula TaxID=3880 RepID=UPI000D2F4038|nr:uncharacterized protein LOC11411561 isoform X3 [Medicago truncatula]
MGGAGGSSKSWEKEIYWTHFQFIHFIQFLQTTTDFQQQLALPKTFSDNLKKKLPGNVTLKGPSGVVWNVGLTARDDTIYFTNGWQRFVKDHSLKENDFLVFKYNGESLFEVLIFHGDSFCEKAASYFVGKCGQAHTEQVCNKGKSSNNSVEEVSTPSNGSVECSLPEKSWEEDIYWTHFQFIHFTQLLPEDFKQQLALPKTFSDNLNKKLPENVTLKGPGGVAWKIGLITRDDTVYFLNGWQRFVNDHSLKDNDFLVFNYNGESHFDVLIFDGESFCEKEASYFVGKCSHTQTELGGSKANETNNSIEEVNTASSDGGVECGLYEKFQDLNNIGTPLAVPVETTNEKTFNAGVESDSPELLIADTVTKTTAIQFPYQPTGKRSKRRRSSTSANCCWRALDRVAYNKQHSVTIAVPSQTTGQKTKKPVNEVTPGRSMKRGRQAKTATSGERSIDWVACNKENSEAANLNRSGKADGHDILSGASLSKLSPHAEKEIAQSFTSSFPYFVKIMKTFNVERPRILNIPYEFSKDHLPNCKIKITLHNLKGEQWTVNSVPRTRLHASHILCGGWLNFVRGNSLKIGDVCIFELIGECELRVRINEVGKDGLDSQVGKLACRLDVASHKTSRFMPKKHKISSKCCAEVDLLDKKLSEICQEAALSSELKKSVRASNTSKKAGLSPKSKASHKKPDSCSEETPH